MARKRRKASDALEPPAQFAGHSELEPPPLEVRRLAHELQVHQEEMEIQNRQLVESQWLLEESRDRYASLYDFAPVAYVTLCPNGVIREINLTGATLLGQPRDRLVDRPFVLFVAAAFRKVFLSHLYHCRHGRTTTPICQLMIRRADGTAVPVELRSNHRPVESPNGSVYLSVLVDLTERQRAEQERERLREAARSERLLRTTLETLPVAVRVIGADGISLLHNQAFGALWAMPPGAPMPPAEQFKGWEADARVRLTPGGWPAALVRSKGKPVLRQKLHVQDFEGNVKVVFQSAVPLVDEGGAVSGAVEVTEDVTRLLAAQETAHCRQEQLEAAFDAAHLSFWDWDLSENRVMWAGPFESLFAGEGIEADGGAFGFLRHVHPEDLEAVRGAVAEAREHRTALEKEFRVILPGGANRWLSAKGRFAYDNRGRAVRMTGVVMDVTQRKLAEEELVRAKERAEEASRLKDDFLATVSHELRTPLSAILLWTHLARSSQSDGEKTEALDTILQSAKAQSQLVDDLLDISRSIAGKLRLNLSATTLAPAVRAAVDSMRPLAESRQITLTAHLSDDVPATPIDPDRIRQVANNLLSNAVKFTPPGGAITVNLIAAEAPSGGQIIRLSVTDTGQGIAPEFLPNVFDRFRQGESGLTRAHGGLGLGLAISRELVHMHGGSIRAESEGLGHGATFTVDIPVHAPTNGKVAAPAPNGAARDNLAGVRVLLVEDDPGQREALDRILKSAGAIVQSAESASAALKAFVAKPPDVLVSDIAMPDEDGYSLLRNVRKLEMENIARRRAQRGGAPANGKKAWNGHTPALALTAHARPEDRAKATDAGFEAHLAKPVEPATLISAVSKLCHRHPAYPGQGRNFAARLPSARQGRR